MRAVPDLASPLLAVPVLMNATGLRECLLPRSVLFQVQTARLKKRNHMATRIRARFKGVKARKESAGARGAAEGRETEQTASRLLDSWTLGGAVSRPKAKDERVR